MSEGLITLFTRALGRFPPYENRQIATSGQDTRYGLTVKLFDVNWAYLSTHCPQGFTQNA